MEDSTSLVRKRLDFADSGGVEFKDLLGKIRDCLLELVDDPRALGRRPENLVFGFPGIVDAAGARVSATNQKYDGALAIDFKKWAKSELGVKLYLENDARLALLGEHYCGAGRGYADVALLTLGTGIGGAVLLDGRALRGASGRSGCLCGHIPVQVDGRLCTCGNIGCAEAEASTWALRGIAEATPGYAQSALAASTGLLNFEQLFASADSGDRVAVVVRQRCYHVWGALAVAMFHAYCPQILLISGGVMARSAEVLSAIRAHVDSHAWCGSGVQIREGKLGTDAALYGAIPRLTEAGC